MNLRKVVLLASLAIVCATGSLAEYSSQLSFAIPF